MKTLISLWNLIKDFWSDKPFKSKIEIKPFELTTEIKTNIFTDFDREIDAFNLLGASVSKYHPEINTGIEDNKMKDHLIVYPNLQTGLNWNMWLLWIEYFCKNINTPYDIGLKWSGHIDYAVKLSLLLESPQKKVIPWMQPFVVKLFQEISYMENSFYRVKNVPIEMIISAFQWTENKKKGSI